jgi:hypothetical protein
MPEGNNIKKKRFVLAHGFRRFGHDLALCTWAECHGSGRVWHLMVDRKQRKEEEGAKDKISPRAHPQCPTS